MLPLITLLACLTSPADYKALKEAALDHDQDGYASAEHPEEGGEDCDDTRAETYPGATEGCDGLDNDCDGTVDEGVTDLEGRYHDRDRDGYGGDPLTECPPPAPEDMSGVPGDCDDNNGAINPLATDVVEDDGRDQNCDGVDGTDGDGDGFASVETGGTDCDDMNVTAYLGAEEVCFDLVDNDCDGDMDEAEYTPCIDEGMLRISELMISSNLPHPYGEWIEVTNTSQEAIILSGLVISIDFNGTLTPQIILETSDIISPGETYLLCFDNQYLQERCDFVYGDGSEYDNTDTTIPNMSASKGQIRLSTEGVEESFRVDSIFYWTAASDVWPSPPEDSLNAHSYELAFTDQQPSDGSESGDWCRNTTDIFYTLASEEGDLYEYGTPGAPNTCTKE